MGRIALTSGTLKAVAILETLGSLLGSVDASLSLLERYRQARTEANFQALKRGLVWVLLMRSLPADEAEDRATFYLRRRGPWRDELDETVDYDGYVQCIDRLGVIGDGGLTPGQAEVMQALVDLTEQHLPRDARYQAAQLRGVTRKLDALLAGTQEASRLRRDLSVLEAGEAPYGEEAVVLAQVGIPLVTPWTSSLEQLFHSWEADHDARFQAWYQGTDPTLAPLERAVRHAVVGEWNDAIDLLLATDAADWPAERQVARWRLLGTLERERGHSERAERSYQRARDLLPRLQPPYRAWLERRLLLDLNSLRSEEDDLADVLDRHDIMLGVPAWFSIPVVDALAEHIASEVALEALEERFKGQRSWRTSSRLYSAWLSYLKATHFAYAAGDIYAVRGLQRLWGRLLLTLPGVPVDDVLETLWRARDSDVLVRILRERLAEAGTALDWPSRLLARPAHPTGIDAEQWHLQVLRATAVLAPLLPDETVDQLRSELVVGLARVQPALREGSPASAVPFVQGRTYTPTYAVDALRALAAQRPLSPAEVATLVASLEGVPFSPYSAWPVLAAHGWRTEDHAAARQAAGFLEVMNTSWHQEEALRLLRDLAITYPGEGLGERFVRALAATPPERLGDWERWWLVLGRPLPEGEAAARHGATAYMTTAVQDLAAIEGRNSVVLGRSHPVLFLPSLLAVKPPVLAPETVETLTRALLDAALQPQQHRGYGRDALRSLRLSWPHLPPALQEALTTHMDSVPSPLLLSVAHGRREREFEVTPAAVPLERLMLRLTAGLPIRPVDRESLIHALLSGHAPDVDAGVAAAQVLLETDSLGMDELFALLLSAGRPESRAAGHALYLLTRFCPAEHGQQAMVGECARLALNAEPRSLNAVSGALQGLAHLLPDHPLRLALRPEVEALRSHTHRLIRRQAMALLGDVPEAESGTASERSNQE